MVGELITLPLRVGVRATRLWLRATEETVAVVAELTGRLIGGAVSSPPSAGRAHSVGQAGGVEAERVVDPERAAVHLEPPAPEPAPADAVEALAEAEPVHGSEEPELVEEGAEPGAEDGAGAEAHAKEAELEAALTAHIALTEKQAYKKRLRQHLTETRDHKRRVASRIKQLGGTAVAGPNLPGVPDAVGEVAGKAVAAVKTQVGTARAVVNNPIERQLRNAQEELREEHVEIAIYSRITAFAEEVGDRETAQLAKAIRRDEERMAKYLDAELGRLVKEVVRTEVPRDQRPTRGRRRRSRRTTASRRTATSRRTTRGSSRTPSRSRAG